ncbi:MAG TPA: TonB family protein [Oleiagrimonas sp.]|nr:TonB family protein [Oleiagrimonas sp.]
MSTSTVSAARPPGSNDLLSATFLFSLIVHGVLILGITFAIAKPEPQLPTLDVTLVNAANRQSPEHADFLAQADNAGGGNSDKARLPSQLVTGLLPTATHGLAPRPLAASAPAPSIASGAHRITTTAASDFAVTSESDQRQHEASERPVAKADLKRRMKMARLAASIDAASKAYAKKPHKKFISASTKEYAYAAYMRIWAKKVERVGTLNFPDAARTGQLSGNLILTVGLNRDGSIHSIDIIQSSGRKVLDDAATRIVRLAAPFPAIPRTKDKVDLLYITRTYQFLRGGELRTH